MQESKNELLAKMYCIAECPKGSVSNKRQVTSKAEDHATQDKIRDLAIQKNLYFIRNACLTTW